MDPKFSEVLTLMQKDPQKAKEQFGKMFDFLSINNRLDATKAQRELGWKITSNKTILDDLENGSYRKFQGEK